jgi:hypothetical protein
MRQRGKLRPHFGKVDEIDFGRDDGGHVGRAGKDSSPGIDDHRISIGREALRIVADLIRRDDVNLIFYGARAHERLPVGFPGQGSKRCRHEDDLSALSDQQTIEFRETQIVANRKSHAAELGFGDDHFRPGLARFRFLRRDAPLDGDIEEMDLAIAREEIALRTEK